MNISCRVIRKIVALSAAVLLSISLMGQENKIFRVGVDASVDCFLSTNSKLSPSVGLGVMTRLGRYDQWLNLVGGVRYIYGQRLSGIQIPILLNVNLLKGKRVSGFIGAGYEFDFIGTYWGCMKIQVGIATNHIGFRVFNKPYQGDIGVGFTYYF